MKSSEKILNILFRNLNTTTSGEKIANELNISRNAVWKAIVNLRESGYQISATTNLGYQLILDSNRIYDILLRSYLSNDIYLEVHDELGSTNTLAKQMINDGLVGDALIVARQQLAGRGRFAKKFYSPQDTGLYFSLVINEIPDQIQKVITIYVALIVSEVIEKTTNKKIAIKWVNDLYLDQKKVAGILCEATMDLESLCMKQVILGIGINVNTPFQLLEDNLDNEATSLCDKDEMLDKNKLLADIVNQLRLEINRYTSTEIITRYKDRLNMLNRYVKVVQSNTVRKVYVNDVMENGNLSIINENNEVEELTSAMISIEI